MALQDRGVRSFIYTDVDRDGSSKGRTSTTCARSPAWCDEPLDLLRRHRDLDGTCVRWPGSAWRPRCAISGRALYEGAFTVAEGTAALTAADRPSPPSTGSCTTSASSRAWTSTPGASSRARASSTCVTRATPSSGRALRRAGRRRARVPRHHRDVRQARHRRRRRAPRGRRDVMPLTVGGGVRTVEDAQAVLDAGADKVSVNSAAVARPELHRGVARVFGTSASSWPSTRAAPRGRPLGGLVAGGRTHGRDAVGGRARSSGSARARSCSRAWIATAPRTATTSSSARGRRACRAGDRLRRRRGRPTTSSTASRRAPTPCSPPRSSTTASTPCPRV